VLFTIAVTPRYKFHGHRFGGGMNSISRVGFALLSLLCGALAAEPSFAQARAQFAVDAVATCQKPAIKELPLHVEGTGVLKADGSARLDVDGGVAGKHTYRTKLGQTAAAAGGSASLRVTGRSTLRATRDYPNHQMITDLQVSGKECTISVRNVLKPGKSQYLFTSGGGTATCDKPRIVRTACQAF
jgi:hypothetical protein